jgi:hypothetical protein
MIYLINTSRPLSQRTRLDRLALLLSRHVADAGQAEDQQSASCRVVASITPATPTQTDNSIKQQMLIQLRSSSLCCDAGTADAGGLKAADARLQQSALPPHVQVVYTLQNSDIGSISKVSYILAYLYIKILMLHVTARSLPYTTLWMLTVHAGYELNSSNINAALNI